VSYREAALETLRRCTQALEGELSSEERSRLCALQIQAIQALSNVYKPETIARAERVRQLLRQMAHMAPGDRAAAIRERMGLARSTYYKLRKLQGRPQLALLVPNDRNRVNLRRSAGYRSIMQPAARPMMRKCGVSCLLLAWHVMSLVCQRRT